MTNKIEWPYDWTVEYNERTHAFDLIMWQKNINLPLPEIVVPLKSADYRAALHEAAAIAVDPQYYIEKINNTPT